MQSVDKLNMHVGYHKTSSSIVIAHTIHLQQNSSVLRSNLINAFRGDRSDRFN